MCTLNALCLTKYTMCKAFCLSAHCTPWHLVYIVHTVYTMCTPYAHCAHCAHWIYHNVASEQIQFFWLSSYPCRTGSLPQRLLMKMIGETCFGCGQFLRHKFHIGVHIKSMNLFNKLSSVHIWHSICKRVHTWHSAHIVHTFCTLCTPCAHCQCAHWMFSASCREIADEFHILVRYLVCYPLMLFSFIQGFSCFYSVIQNTYPT